MWELRHACGGALIATQWVLTAAHCFKNNYKADRHEIRLDADVLSEASSKPVAIEKIIPHPDYKAATLQNDLALIKISPYDNDVQVEPFSASSSLMSDNNYEDNIYAASMLSGGRYIDTYGANKTRSIWQAKNAKNIFSSEASQNYGDDLDIIDIGRNKILIRDTAGVHLKDLIRGKNLFDFNHGYATMGFELMGNKKQILTWGSSKEGPDIQNYSAKLWSLKTGKTVQTFDHPNPFYYAALVGKNRMLTTDVKKPRGFGILQRVK